MRFYKAFVDEFSPKQYEEAVKLLSEDRKQAVLRKRFEADRIASVLGEHLARQAISTLSGIPMEQIEFWRNEDGKPFCKNADVYFSVSHSKNAVICAVSDSPIGADVELIREVNFDITRFAFLESDMDYLSLATDEKSKRERFFEIWTAKEAFVKYKGTGMRDMATVSYEEIKDRCEKIRFGDYIATVYKQ